VIFLRVKVVKLCDEVKDLRFAHEGDSGIDLYSMESFELKPLERKIVGTGIRIAIEKGFEAQVRPKSGLALNHGITLLNSPGTIDSSYRGEIKVIVINLSNKPVVIEKGQKIAQLVFSKIVIPEIEYVKELDKTSRNENGFGSTGLS
jgi:dUTP pyrophosphatase